MQYHKKATFQNNLCTQKAVLYFSKTNSNVDSKLADKSTGNHKEWIIFKEQNTHETKKHTSKKAKKKNNNFHKRFFMFPNFIKKVFASTIFLFVKAFAPENRKSEHNIFLVI